jgi:winged helix DNA-binding protein
MSPSERDVVVDRDRIVHHVLAKHHLLSETAADDAVRVADDLVGLHGTSAMSPYLALHARLRVFASGDLDRELYERRSLFRLKGMRGTVFVLSRRIGPIVFAATRATTLSRDRRWLGLDDAVYAEAAPAVLEALAGGSLSLTELRKLLHADVDVSGVVALLCDEGRLVRDRPMGGHKSSAFRYRRWDEAFPDVDLAAYDEPEAARLLVRQYVAAYGPVTVADIVWWSGLPATRVREAVAALTGETVAVSVRDLDGQFLMTGEEFDAASAARHGRAATISLLPQLDPYTMGYRDRARFLDPAHQDLVLDRGGNATSVVLVDGCVAGVWDLTGSCYSTAVSTSAGGSSTGQPPKASSGSALRSRFMSTPRWCRSRSAAA